MTGTAGQALRGTISFSDKSSHTLSVRISGVPSGMTFAVSGATLAVNWPSPVTGTYTLNVLAKDENELTAAAVISVAIAAN